MSNVMGTYVKFTKTTHKIWPCHVTLASNSEKFYFSPNSILNFRESYSPPTAYRVNMATSTYFDNTVVCSNIKLIFGTCIPSQFIL